MTAAVPAAASPLSCVDWIGLLRGAIRTEFAVDIYRPDLNDPILRTRPCDVAGCALPRTGRGLCDGHEKQWQRNDRQPVLDVFVRTAPPLLGHGLPMPCAVPSCIGPAFIRGLCNAHWMRFRKTGTGASVADWALSADPAVQRKSTEICGYDGCACPVRGLGLWCDFHTRKWEKAGKPEPGEWLQACRDYGNPTFRFTGLAEPLRSELQYLLQRRHDESRSKLRPLAMHTLATIAAEHGAVSLRNLSEHVVIGGAAGEVRALLRWGQDRLQQLKTERDQATGLDADLWNLRHLGCDPHASRATTTVRFDGIAQPWLRTVVKRWVRHRMITGLSGGTLQNNARHLAAFAVWLHGNVTEISGFASLTRHVLEEWLTAVHLDPNNGVAQRNTRVGTVRTFLEDCRRHGWADDLPTNAVLHRSDFVKEPDLLPRALPEHVIRQLESETALAQVGNPIVELIIRVLIETGLRISHVLKLPVEALQRDPSGHWCLHVLDTKVRREHALPLTDTLAEHLVRQRDEVCQRWPSDDVGLALFPRPTGNPDGRRAYAYGTFRDCLDGWLERCDLRDEQGRAVRVTAHQFRHTLGTRMINNGVPQHVVQEWLNHRSAQMTTHYARLRQETLRREWEAYRERVNIAGDVVMLDPSAPSTDAEWMKHNLHTASETLPNGYCGRPPQRECEVPNACLTCPDFLTDVSFLPIHQEQRAATLTLVESAEQRGHQRMAETNRRVLASLDNIITGLARLRNDEKGSAHAEIKQQPLPPGCSETTP